MDIFVTKIFLVALSARSAKCTVAGLSYMDPLNFRPLPDKDYENPCNPLYWYPRQIPEYCYMRTPQAPQAPEAPDIPPGPIPLPIPVPLPPMPPPIPLPPPLPAIPIPLPPAMPFPPPPLTLMPAIPPQLPFGLPIVPLSPMLPVPGVPYSPQSPSLLGYSYRDQVGMVPGIRGLVSEDGGINILPFSDAYSDMLEKHKNKMIRKKLRKLFNDYDNYPYLKKRRRRKRIYY